MKVLDIQAMCTKYFFVSLCTLSFLVKFYSFALMLYDKA